MFVVCSVFVDYNLRLLISISCTCTCSVCAASRYRITSTIGARVSRLNPAWNDANKDFDVSVIDICSHSCTVSKCGCLN